MQDSLTLTLLGTGSSGGVPRVGNVWGDCDPTEPHNRRRRCALLIEKTTEHTDEHRKTTVVIDAGADHREQMLDANVHSIEAVVLTHPHADHIFGLDDLRQMAINLRRPIDVWMDASTRPPVMAAFGYCFHQKPGTSYPTFCVERSLTACEPFFIDGPAGSITLNTLIAEHGDIHALGVRAGNAVYLPDVKRISDARSLNLLKGVDTLIVDALRYTPHPSHMNLEESLAFIEQVKPRRAILTNMHSDLDYNTLRDNLPDHVVPGYDGMQLDLT